MVVALLGIVLGLTVLATGRGSAERLDNAATALASTVSLAQSEAVLRQRPLGLVLASDAYHLVQYAGTWTAPPADPLFRLRSLPPGVSAASIVPAADPDTPPVVLFPDGEIEMPDIRLSMTGLERPLIIAERDGRLVTKP